MEKKSLLSEEEKIKRIIIQRTLPQNPPRTKTAEKSEEMTPASAAAGRNLKSVAGSSVKIYGD